MPKSLLDFLAVPPAGPPQGTEGEGTASHSSPMAELASTLLPFF